MNALIIVDVQNDFLPGGALAVNEGDTIIPAINALQNDFDLVVATQDWHPADHKSFASAHAGKKVFDEINLSLSNNRPYQSLSFCHCQKNRCSCLYFYPFLF